MSGMSIRETSLSDPGFILVPLTEITPLWQFPFTMCVTVMLKTAKLCYREVKDSAVNGEITKIRIILPLLREQLCEIATPTYFSMAVGA